MRSGPRRNDIGPGSYGIYSIDVAVPPVPSVDQIGDSAGAERLRNGVGPC